MIGGRWAAGAVGLLLSMVAGASALAAAPASVRQYADLVLSPAGDRIAAIETDEPIAPTVKEPHGRIVIRAATDGRILQTLDPCAGCKYVSLAWSPDGTRLAFLEGDDEAATARLETAAGKTLKTLATVHGLAGHARWSPDGRSIALLAVVGAHKKIGATEAGAAQVGEIGEVNDEQRIGVVPASGGEVRLVSPADTWIYEYDWTPDGRGFVATAAKGNGDNNWWVAKLVAVDGATGAARTIAAPDVQMNYPRVSPDGKSVAFIGGLMSDFGSVGGDLYTVPLAGGAPRDITPGYKGSFTSLDWIGDRLRGSALIGADTANFSADPQTGAVKIEAQASFSFAAGDGKFSFTADGKQFAATVQSFERAPAIGVHITGEPRGRLITHDNDALPPFVSARSVTWKSGDYDVQGWLLAPLTVAPGLHPMITVIHGGPSSASAPTYIVRRTGRDIVGRGPIRDLVERGYFVFLPNPRGSYGQGEAFTRANVRDFGGGDLKDILAGVDAVEKAAPIDDKRLGVMGHSYGGFMTMWTVTHTGRFKAAVAGAGIANWISYYGENGIDTWMIPFFGASAYDDPAIYRKLSPLSTIKDAKTPTFIYVGEHDVECPSPQSMEFWHGLKAVGAPTSLVIFQGEGHGIRNPKHLDELEAKEFAWFDRYLGGR